MTRIRQIHPFDRVNLINLDRIVRHTFLKHTGIDSFRVSLFANGTRLPFAFDKQMVSGYLVIIGDAGACSFHLDTVFNGRWPGHLHFNKDRFFPHSLRCIPEVLRFRQTGVDPPGGLAQRVSQRANIKIHHPMSSMPRSCVERSPAGGRKRGKYP